MCELNIISPVCITESENEKQNVSTRHRRWATMYNHQKDLPGQQQLETHWILQRTVSHSSWHTIDRTVSSEVDDLNFPMPLLLLSYQL